jgi:hypothetical protein
MATHTKYNGYKNCRRTCEMAASLALRANHGKLAAFLKQ